MKERRLPGNPSSAVYGTIVAAGQLAIESSTDHSIATVAVSLSATLGVFWLAHAYTDTLGSAIGAPTGDPPTFVHALRAEWPIAESAVLPLIALAIAALAGARPSSAALAALVVAVLELVGWSVLAVRRAQLHGARAVRYCVIVAVMGLALIGLKYLIH